MRAKSLDILVICAIVISAVVLTLYKASSPMGTKPAGPTASAIRNVRTIYTSEMLFYDKHKRYATLSAMADEERISDAVFTQGADNYYRYEVRLTGNQVEVFATPLSYNSDTRESFYISSSTGIIHRADQQGKEAGANDPAIE